MVAPMTARAKFTAVDVTRAIKGAKAAGLAIERVEIEPSGKITIITSAAPEPRRDNPLDRLLLRG